MLYRRLDRVDLGRIADVDRTEPIEAIYVQHGARLELAPGEWSAPAWDLHGTGEHSVAAQRDAVERLLDAGAIALGAFDGERLVGIGVVLPHLRPTVAQLAYLHVSNGHRGRGIGRRLADQLEQIARRAGDESMVVSATPSLNTVRFYRRLGYEPMAEPLAELSAVEPEDVHMWRPL